MSSRLNLHTRLIEVLGTTNVYYQPPASITMNYPAIVYSRDNIASIHANDTVYASRVQYQVIVIDKDPDSIVVDKIAALPTCKFDRQYSADNLNHDVFILQF